METHIFKFPLQKDFFFKTGQRQDKKNKVYVIKIRQHSYVKGDKLRQWYSRIRTEKSSNFNKISVEHKATKLPQDHMKRGVNEIRRA